MKNIQTSKVDEKDLLLLRELSNNSRQSFRKIAQKIGISTMTVISKYDKLAKSGIIKKPSLVVDFEKLGYSFIAIIEINVSKGKLTEVERLISKKPQVFAVYDITGETDALVLARFKSREDLNTFIKSLSNIEFVDRTNTHVILNVVKEDFGGLL